MAVSLSCLSIKVFKFQMFTYNDPQKAEIRGLTIKFANSSR